MVDEENYLLVCRRYIELNPVRATMVTAPGDYAWSSYQANGFGRPMKLWSPHRVYHELGAMRQRATAYRELFRGQVDTNMLHRVRQAAHQGMALGSDKFK